MDYLLLFSTVISWGGWRKKNPMFAFCDGSAFSCYRLLKERLKERNLEEKKLNIQMANLTFAKIPCPLPSLKPAVNLSSLHPLFYLWSQSLPSGCGTDELWNHWGMEGALRLLAIYLWKLLPSIPGEGERKGCGMLVLKCSQAPLCREVLVFGWSGAGGALQLPPCALCLRAALMVRGCVLEAADSSVPLGEASSCFWKVPADIRLCFDWDYSNICLNAYS